MEYRKLKDLKLLDRNPRTIKDDDFKKLVQSIEANPDYFEARPLILSDRTGDLVIIAGNQRYKAAKELKLKEVPTFLIKDLTEEREKEIIIRDNVSNGQWDWDILANEWNIEKLNDWGLDLPVWSEQDTEIINEPATFDNNKDEEITAIIKLKERFVVPPFTILDSRQGYWNERKSYWQTLINDYGESRENTLRKSKSSFPQYYHHKNIVQLKIGHKLTNTEFEEKYFDEIYKNSTILNNVSILDPVLSEIINKWFGLEKCKTFDCFAGDSVFGYVSSYLGNQFTGIELRQEQTDLNNEKIKGFPSKYICDDGQNVLKHIEKNSQDLLFSCPPYFNLEVYSDLPNDASNQKEYKDFLKILDNAFTNAIKCLKDNRFAVITVGDVRDSKGFYYRFVDDIKDIFKNNDLHLLNELIFIEKVGNLAMRANKLMENRKIGKCHQNVLVFFKGDPKQIKNIFPIIQVNEESEINDNDITLATELDMPELIQFRKPFIKDKFIMYLSGAIIQDAVDKQRLYLLKKDGKIKAYLWLNNMQRKQVCKIEEICSTIIGGGTKFMQFAEQQSKFKTMYLEVVDYNENAINFYKNKGYSITDKKVGEKITNLVMTKHIDNESTDV